MTEPQGPQGDSDLPVIVEKNGHVEDLVEGGHDGDTEQMKYDDLGEVPTPARASAPYTQHEPIVDTDTEI